MSSRKHVPGAMTVDELRDQVEPAPEVLELKDQIRKLSNALEGMRQDQGHLEVLMGEVTEAVHRIKPCDSFYVPPKGKVMVSNPCSAVAHLTDIHYGACQKPDEIEGFREYNPTVSRKAVVDTFAPHFLEWVELHRGVYCIDELVIVVTADAISGDIHNELRVTNAFPIPVQAVGVGYMIADFVRTTAPYFKNIRVECITDDNHGRLTAKPQCKEGGLNNMMYVVAHIAKSRLELLKNVTFNVWEMNEKVIQIQNTRYLIMHGHGIQGWAGYPWYGTARKAGKEALARMNMPSDVHFHKMLMGHWHSPLFHQHFIVGGSVSGTDAYDHKDGRHAPPSQTGWLVHPKLHEVDWNVFWL